MLRSPLLAGALGLLAACTGGDPNERFVEDVVRTADATFTLDVPDTFVPSVCPEVARHERVASGWIEFVVGGRARASYPADIRTLAVKGTQLYYGAQGALGAQVRQVGIDGTGDQQVHEEPQATYFEHLAVHGDALYFYATLGEAGPSFRTAPLTGGSSEPRFEGLTVSSPQAAQYFTDGGAQLVLGGTEGTAGHPFQNRVLRRDLAGNVDVIYARNTDSPVTPVHARVGNTVYVSDLKADGSDTRVVVAVPIDGPPVDTDAPPNEGPRAFANDSCTAMAGSGSANLFCLGAPADSPDSPMVLRHYSTSDAAPATARVLFDGIHAAAEGGTLTPLLAASDDAAFVVTASPGGFSSVLYKVDLQGVVTVLACKQEPLLELVYADDALYFAAQSGVQDAHGLFRIKRP